MTKLELLQKLLDLRKQLLSLLLKEQTMPTPIIPSLDKKLINAIIQVESGGALNAIGDKHLTQKAYGPMQIRQPAVDDVNRVFKTKHKAQDMLNNLDLSIWVFEAYMSIYATPQRVGRIVTDEDRARIWNGGPTGWKRPTTIGYWNKVKKHL